jgi:hypothetical protein
MGGVFDPPLHGLVLAEAEFETDVQAHVPARPRSRSPNSPRSRPPFFVSVAAYLDTAWCSAMAHPSRAIRDDPARTIRIGT